MEEASHLPTLSWLLLLGETCAIKFELFAWIMADVEMETMPQPLPLPFTNCDCGSPTT